MCLISMDGECVCVCVRARASVHVSVCIHPCVCLCYTLMIKWLPLLDCTDSPILGSSQTSLVQV